jgi:enoyl-CoA hydratase
LSLVSIQDRDGIAVVALDRPPANAFSAELVEELASALESRAAARAVVLTSTSPKIFSGGWDLSKVSVLARPDMEEFLENYCDLVRRLFTFPAPIVAALPGHAIAGGLIVAAAADERYAAEGPGRFGLSEVALGVPLPASCLELFRYLLGGRRMERLAASAQNESGEPAVALGLLDGLVPAADLLDFALERAGKLARGSASAYAEVKRRARAEALLRFDAARADDPFLDFWFSEDARARIAALLEKLQRH